MPSSRFMVSPEPTNVILLCDDACMKGLYATMNSVVANCATPEHLHFYIGLETKEGASSVAYTLAALFGNAVSDITVVDVHSVSHLVQWYDEVSKLLTKQRTANMMNYARFFVADMFPQLAANPKNTYIYMDVDKIIYGDVRAHDLELKSKYGVQGGRDNDDRNDNDGQFVVVGLDESRTVFRSLGLQSWRARTQFLIFSKRHSIVDHRTMCPFNAGYYAATIGLFYDMPRRCKRMIQLGLLDICTFNTQPLMMCLLAEKTRAELWNWNKVNYGWKPGLSVDRATMGSIHWNGPGKGWDENNEYHWAFKEYEVTAAEVERAVTAARGRDSRRLEDTISP